MTTTPRGNLPDISFIDTNPAAIEARMIKRAEEKLGRTLSKGDPLRLVVEAFAAEVISLSFNVDYAAKRNLLSYTGGAELDHIAPFVGIDRTPPGRALTTLRYTLSSAQSGVYIIPAGTQAAAGQVLFETTEPLEIGIGQISADVTARALTAGVVGNGFAIGQIRTQLNPLPFIESVSNITPSAGGTDWESDDSLVTRYRLAPNAFSSAGPRSAYVFHALSANPAISDVAVSSPDPADIKQLVLDVLADHDADALLIADMTAALDAADWPGTVDVRPLLAGGVLPTPEILEQVDAALSADEIRPLTDYVKVQAPEAATYAVDVEYWVLSSQSARAAQIQAAVNKAVADYVQWQKAAIGRDINPDELIYRMKAAGAKRIVINSPAFTVLGPNAVAQESGVTVAYQGLEND